MRQPRAHQASAHAACVAAAPRGLWAAATPCESTAAGQRRLHCSAGAAAGASHAEVGHGSAAHTNSHARSGAERQSKPRLQSPPHTTRGAPTAKQPRAVCARPRGRHRGHAHLQRGAGAAAGPVLRERRERVALQLVQHAADRELALVQRQHEARAGRLRRRRRAAARRPRRRLARRRLGAQAQLVLHLLRRVLPRALPGAAEGLGSNPHSRAALAPGPSWSCTCCAVYSREPCRGAPRD